MDEPMRHGDESVRGERIYWVTQYVGTPDQPGGTRHYEMASTLRTRGYDVRLVASDLTLTSRRYSRRDGARDRRAIEENVSGVPIVWLPAGSYERNDWRRGVGMALFAWHAAQYLVRDARRSDIIIGSSPQLLAAAAARLAALLRATRFVLEVRDLWPESLTAVSGKRGLLAAALQLLANMLYRTSHAIVILAEGNRARIEHHGGRPARIIFVPNGADSAAFEGPAVAPPPSLSWIADSPTFVYAGAHGPANGLEITIEAASLLKQRGRQDIRVLLVGDGPAKSDLQREAHGRGLTNLVFHDPIAKEAIPGLLRCCAGGLMLLKDAELFRFGVSPNKLFDYLASGLPVITNVPGEVASTVERAEAGIVIRPHDAKGLADAMISIVDGAVTGGNGPSYIREHHDRHVLVDRFSRMIDAISRQKPMRKANVE